MRESSPIGVMVPKSQASSACSLTSDCTKIIDLSGTWNAVDDKNAKGIISTNNVAVNWVFSEDFSFLTNNKGVVFKRIKVK